MAYRNDNNESYRPIFLLRGILLMYVSWRLLWMRDILSSAPGLVVTKIYSLVQIRPVR